MLIFTIGFGSGAIAGEEEQGTLDLLLSNPVARWRVVLEKFGAMIIGTLLIAFVFWTALSIGGNIIDMSLHLGRLGAACFSAALLGIAYGAVALAVSAGRGRRGLSIGVAGALGVIGYLLNAMAPLIDWLEPYQDLSPFYYYISSDPLNNGLHAGHTGVLLGLAALFLIVALVTFRKRDLAV
jgi:ABC-2 type transport system permease protein